VTARRFHSSGELALVWAARGKILAALHALTRPEPDYAAARRLLDGAIESAEALAWIEGVS
jgi:hypothetical protein